MDCVFSEVRNAALTHPRRTMSSCSSWNKATAGLTYCCDRPCQRAQATLAFCAITRYRGSVNNKHRKTLDVVFTDPLSSSLDWSDLEALLQAAGAQLIEGRGSRVRFEKAGEVATFHRPHPAKEAKRYQLRDARDFLERIGVRP
jgi:hypothetical protein